MKIILVNKFLYPRGGDAVATLATGRLLARKGHEVFYWGMGHPDNPAYPHEKYFVSRISYSRPLSLPAKIRASLKLLYSIEAKKKFREFVRFIKPDVIHLNNIAHQLSPSILNALPDNRIPMVMTLHDYKVVCPAWYLLSRGKACESCGWGRYYFCTLKKCNRGSVSASFLNTAEMYLHHKLLDIYGRVNLFIAPSSFLAEKVAAMGFCKQIVRLPHFIETEDVQPACEPSGQGYILYAGRLSAEKGLLTLFKAIKGLPVQLRIAGIGPIRELLGKEVKQRKLNNVEFLGYQTRKKLEVEMRGCLFTVLPSEWYEVFGLSVLESFALGKPVAGSRIGGIPEIIRDNENGLLFEPGNPADLRAKICALLDNPAKISAMGKQARKSAEEDFSPDKYYARLMEIYQSAGDRKQ